MNLLDQFISILSAQNPTPSRATVKNYRADVAKFIRWFEQEFETTFDPKALRTQTVEAYKQAMTKNSANPTNTGQTRFEQRLALRSMDRHLSSLRKFFNFLKLKGEIEKSPFEIGNLKLEIGNSDPFHLKGFRDHLYVFNASDLTIKNYINDVKQFFAWASIVLRSHLDVRQGVTLENRNIFKHINAPLLEEYKNRLQHEAGLSPVSINRKLSSIRRYLTFAQGEGFIDNKALGVQPLKAGVRLSPHAEDEQRLHLDQGATLTSNLTSNHIDLDQHSSLGDQVIHTPKYSNIPPIRLFQRFGHMITLGFEAAAITPLAALALKLHLLGWQLKGGSVFVKARSRITNQESGVKPQMKDLNSLFRIHDSPIRGFTKAFYNPHGISLASLPVHKRLWHHARHTRPQWYKKYHENPVVHYFHFAILVIIMTAIGTGMYQSFISDPNLKKASAAPTAPPRILSFQGRLTDAQDNPITTATQLRFMIYNDATASGAARLWEEVRTINPDQDGIFSILLGSGTGGANAALCNGGLPPSSPATGPCGIPQSLFGDNAALWLGITVLATDELQPRQQIATVPYATNSELLQGMAPITQVGAGTTNVILALNSSGNLAIGGSAAPVFQATGGSFTLQGTTTIISTTTGSGGNVTLAPDGLGKVDLQKPIFNSTNNNNILGAAGSVEIDDSLSVLGTTSASLFTLEQQGTGPLISASVSGVTKFVIGNTGSITSAAYTNAGGILYTATTGLIAQTAIGTSAQCLIGGTIPSFASCPSGTTDPFWQQTLGALTPNNSTVDLLIGGQATTSAKFAVLNMNSGTPTASLSAGTAGGAYLTATGNLATTAMQTLTLGGSTTGNVVIDAGSGLITLADATTISSNLTVAGTTGISLTGSGADITFSTGTNTISSSGTLEIGAHTLTGAITGNAQNVTGLGDLSAAGTITFSTFNANNASLYATVSTGVLAAASTNTTNLCLISGATAPAWASCNTGTTDFYWSQANGALYANNSTVDLLIGGQATTSAKFAVLNVNSGTPTASVSAGTTGAVYLTADGKLATTAKQTLTLGDSSTTGNIILQGGNVGVGITNPSAKVDVDGNFAVTYTSNDAFAFSMRMRKSRGANIVQSGDELGAFNYYGYDGASYLTAAQVIAEVDGTPGTNDMPTRLMFRTTADGASSSSNRLVIKSNGNIGIGTDTPTALLDVAGAASVSGSLSFRNAAGLIAATQMNDLTIGNTATGKLILNPSGNIGIGTTAPGTKLDVVGGSIRTDADMYGGDLYLGYDDASATITTNDTDENLTIDPNGTGTITLTTTTLTLSGTTTITASSLDTLTSSATLGVSATTLNLGAGAAATIGTISDDNLSLSPNGTGDIRLVNDADTSIIMPGFTSNGGVLYADGSGVLAQVTAGTSTQCLIGGTTPSFGSCGGFWDQQNGALYPNNSTVDLLIGGQSTASAKFAIINMNAGNPTATISGNLSLVTPTGGAAASKLNILNGGSFGIRTSDGGDAGLSERISLLQNGNVGIGITNPGFLLEVAGTARINGSTTIGDASGDALTVNAATLSLINASTLDLADSQTSALNIETSLLNFDTANSRIGIGTTTPTAKLDVNGAASVSGTLSFRNTATSAIVATQLNDLTIGDSATGKVILNPSGNIGIGLTNPAQKLDVFGNFKVSGTTTFNTVAYTWPGADGSSGYALTTNGAGTLSWSPSGALGTNHWGLTNGTLYPFNSTVDLLIGGQSTASAKFAVINMNSGTPTASLSAGVAGGSFFTADGTFATTNRQTLTIGNSATYNTTGQVLINPNGTGNVGIGVTNPGFFLEVGGTARINGNTTLGDASGDSVTVNAATLSLVNASTLDLANTQTSALNIEGGLLNFDTTNSFIGMGTTTPTAKLDVRGSATISATLSLGPMLQIDAGACTVSTAGKQYYDGIANSYYFCNGTAWVQVGSGSGTSWWNMGNGLLYPINATLDLAIGGTSTSAAKFAFINVNSGNPTATIAGNLALAVPTTAGANTLKLLNNSTLNIQTSVGGDAGATSRLFIASDGAGGNIGIGTTTPTSQVEIKEAVSGAEANLLRAVNENGGYSFNLTTDINNHTNLDLLGPSAISHQFNSYWQSYINNNNYASAGGLNLGGTNNNTGFGIYVANSANGAGYFAGNVGVGTTTPTAILDVAGDASTSGSLVFRGSTPNTIDVLNGTRLDFQTSPGGDAGLASKMTLLSNGNVGIGTTAPAQKLSVAGSATISATLSLGPLLQIDAGACTVSSAGKMYYDAPTNSYYFCNGTVWGQMDSGSFWAQSNGALFPYNSTVDLLIGGQSTASAKFAALNMNGSGTPTASVSSGVSGNGMYLTADGTLSTTNRQTLTIGNSSTYNTTGNLVIHPNGTGNVGIGTTTPDSKLRIDKSSSLITTTTEHTTQNYFFFNPASAPSGGSKFALLSSGQTYGTADLSAATVYSGYFQPYNTNTETTNGANHIGLYADAYNASTGKVGTMVGVQARINNQSTGTITNAYGIRTAAFTNTVGGTITNTYGLYLGDVTPTDGTQTNQAYGVYQEDTGARNYFGGNVGVGTTAPLAKFHVNSTLGTAPAASVSANSNSFAAMVIDNSGLGSLLTASSSGMTRFEVTNLGDVIAKGQIQMGNYTAAQATTLTPVGRGALYYNTTDNQLYISNDGTTWSTLSGQTTIPLTNTSGGSVAQYSIVIQDTTADSSFTTTTTAYNTKVIGIMSSSTCASSAICLVTVSGETTVRIANDVARGDYIYTSTTAGQAFGSAKLSDGMLGVALTSGSAGGTVDIVLIPQLSSLASAMIDKASKHNEYRMLANDYLETNTGTSPNTNVPADGLFFDNFTDNSKVGTNAATGGPWQQSAAKQNTSTAPNTPVAPYRTGLVNGQTYATSTTDNNALTYLGSNTVNKIAYYDRTRDSSAAVQVNLGIDPNWYNGVTLSVASTSSTFSQNDTNPNQQVNPNLSTSYNGSVILVSGQMSTSLANPAKTVYITVKSTTANTITFDWSDGSVGKNGVAATFAQLTELATQGGINTGVFVRFMKATYNTGDVFRIASWYIENTTGSTTRGAKAQFPERSYITAESTAVSIIDADTQKLWMRFTIAGGSNADSTLLGATGNPPTSISALNGVVYAGTNPSHLTKIAFNTDGPGSGEYFASGFYAWTGSIAQRNVQLGLPTATIPGMTLVSTQVNDVAAAVIPNQPTGEVTTTGWGYVMVSSGTSTNNETVNLPYKFNTIPNVVVNFAGAVATTAPTTLSSCGAGASIRVAGAANISTSSFTTTVYNATGNEGSNMYYCYTWTATGTVSPRQYVAVATGSITTDGGTTIINETDQSAVNVSIGSQLAGTFWTSKIALANNALYFSTNDASSAWSYISVYYGVGGRTSSEATIGQYRNYYYGATANLASLNNSPHILGPATGQDVVKSLTVTPGTSTADGTSNTLYVGTTAGLSVLQEKQGHANLADGSIEVGGSVKNYTAAANSQGYITEDMVGDIRGMWPLSADGVSSGAAISGTGLADASIRGNTLTQSGNPSYISGVRGMGGNFVAASSQYLTSTGSSLALTGDMTAGIWIKPGNTTAAVVMNQNGGFILTYSNGASIGTANKYNCGWYDSVGATFRTVTSGTSIESGKWVNIACSISGTTMSIYVNGILENTGTFTGTRATPTNNWYIGGSAGSYNFTGVIDEPYVTAYAVPNQKVKQIYEVGYRALQSHTTNLGSSGGADTNQALAGGTNMVADAKPDFNNQYMYVSTSDLTAGGRVSQIDLNSDSNIKTYKDPSGGGVNVPAGGTQPINGTNSSLAVSYNLEAVSASTAGVMSMAPDTNANALSGDFISASFAAKDSFTQAYVWLSAVKDSQDSSNTINVSLSNDGGVTYNTCNLSNTDSAQIPPEYEYFCQMNEPGSTLMFKASMARGSTKTSTYITRYGIGWIDNDSQAAGVGGNGFYTGTNATLADSSALSVTHNGNTNDIILNGWIYENGQWRAIDTLGGTNHTIADSGLRGWWKLNETSGNAADTSGVSGTLTANGTITYKQTSPMNFGTTFNGTTGAFSCTDGACGGTTKTDTTGTVWSVGAWVKPVSVAGNQAIIAKENNAANTGYMLWSSSGVPQFRINSGVSGANNVAATTVMNVGQWYYVTGTYDGANIKIYVNGVLEGTFAYTTAIADDAGSFVVGARFGFDLFFNGTIDEAFIQAATLSADQILQLYRLGMSQDKFSIVQTSADTAALYNWTGAAQNVRLDVITGFTGQNNGTVSLAPAAADVDTQSFSNSIWVNKTGIGGTLLKLQQNGTDVFTITPTYLAAAATATMSASFNPGLDNTYNLGASESARWKDLYLGPTSLHVQCKAGEGAGCASQTVDWGVGVNTANGNFQIMPNGTSANNTAKLSITQAGNVGIGTTAPTTSINSTAGKVLDLTTSSVGPALTLHLTSSTQEFALINNGAGTFFDIAGAATATNNGFHFRTGNTNSSYSVTERMTILSDGNVGIGAVTPIAPLQVIRLGAASAGILFTDDSANNYRTKIQADFSAGAATSNTLKFLVSDGTTTGQATVMTMLGNGNVGIGTTAPGTKLDITQASSSTNVNGIRMMAATADFRMYAESAAVGAGDIGTFSNHRMRFFTNSTLQATILADGNVGINTTAPTAKFDVYNSEAAEAARFGGNAASYITIGNGLTSTTGSYIQYDDTNNRMNISPHGITAMTIQSDGNVGVGITAPIGDVHIKQQSQSQGAGGLTFERSDNTNKSYMFMGGNDSFFVFVNGTTNACSTPGTAQWSCSSDRRQKENIQVVGDDALSLLNKLKPSTFNFISDPDKPTAGFIAQEVLEVFPEAVSMGPHGYYLLNMTYMIPYLVKGTQELDVRAHNTELSIATHSAQLAGVTNINLSTAGNLEIAATPDPIRFEIKKDGTVFTQIAALSEAWIANLKVGSLDVKQLTINGESIRDYIVRIVTEAGLGVQPLNSPIASIDRVYTNALSPLPSGNGAITIDGNLAVAGSATISGKLTAKSLEAQDASFSGTLRARNIIADNIEGLNARIATISAATLQSMRDSVILGSNATPGSDSGQARMTNDDDFYTMNSASRSALLASLGLLDQQNYFASTSANFGTLIADFGTFNQGLLALGPSSFTDVSVSGQFSVGSLYLNDNSINTLGADLEIQPLAQGGIRIMGGKISINTNGDVQFGEAVEFAKNVRVNGKIIGSVISPIPDEDLVIELGTDGLGDSRFLVKNATGSAVFSINQNGDISASGSASFAKLNFNLIKPAIATGAGDLIAFDAVGVATISATRTEITVHNSQVTDKSLIYLTPVGTTAQNVYLMRQKSGESFTVGGANNAVFNWLIIN